MQNTKSRSKRADSKRRQTRSVGEGLVVLFSQCLQWPSWILDATADHYPTALVVESRNSHHSAIVLMNYVTHTIVSTAEQPDT